MESAAMGLLSGLNALRLMEEKNPVVPPSTTAMGALIHHITRSPGVSFQPMNINFGLFPPLPGRIRGRRKKQLLGQRALEELERWKERSGV
jgi:methylenetetrahydrofolate--tRNA-(uracil-5-)-methyltransferase